jgi:hypothetical protein
LTCCVEAGRADLSDHSINTFDQRGNVRLLAELTRRELVPAIWLPWFDLRQERGRARWRLFLVRKRSSLKHRVRAQLLAFGVRRRQCQARCGVKGRP